MKRLLDIIIASIALILLSPLYAYIAYKVKKNLGSPVLFRQVRPGCRETVKNGVNGFLVPKWNPEALAEKMLYFIEHPEQVHIMGNESHKIAIEEFDTDKVNQRLLEILEI